MINVFQLLSSFGRGYVTEQLSIFSDKKFYGGKCKACLAVGLLRYTNADELMLSGAKDHILEHWQTPKVRIDEEGRAVESWQTANIGDHGTVECLSKTVLLVSYHSSYAKFYPSHDTPGCQRLNDLYANNVHFFQDGNFEEGIRKLVDDFILNICGLHDDDFGEERCGSFDGAADSGFGGSGFGIGGEVMRYFYEVPDRSGTEGIRNIPVWISVILAMAAIVVF